MSALTEILHAFRRNLLFIGGGFWLAEGCALAAGANPVPGDLAGIALGAAAAVLAYPSVREGVLRCALRRPRRIMTPDDYKRLREMETELGWEPSGPCMPVKVPASPVMTAEHARRLALSGAGSVSFSSLSGSGFLSAHACDCGSSIAEVHVPESASPVAFYCACCGKRTRDDVAHVIAPRADHQKERVLAYEGALHFMRLAKVGRESCLSPCPLCEARDRHYPTPEARAVLAAKLAAFDDAESLRRWTETQRWEQ